MRRRINWKNIISLAFLILVICAMLFNIKLVFDYIDLNKQVKEEVNWAQQTYNIVSVCRDLKGMHIPVLFYDDGVKQFYC